MAKLFGLSVTAHASLLNPDARSPNLDTLRRDFGATKPCDAVWYTKTTGFVSINLQLIDIISGTTIWVDRLDDYVQGLRNLQDILSERIVNHLAVQITLEEQALLERHHTDNPEALDLYRQALGRYEVQTCRKPIDAGIRLPRGNGCSAFIVAPQRLAGATASVTRDRANGRRGREW
jgi:hypothetical protein